MLSVVLRRIFLRRKPKASSASAQGAQNAYSTDSKADDRCERCDQHQIGAEMDKVGGDCADGEDQSQHVKPQRRMNARVYVFAEPELKEQGGEANRGNYNEG